MSMINFLRPIWRILPINIYWRQRIKHFLLNGPLTPFDPQQFAVLDLPAWEGEWKVLLPPLDQSADRILIIDWKPPTPDLDSGSYRLSLIIELLLEQGRKVDFIGDREAEHPRYAVALKARGITTVIGQSAAIEHLAAYGHRYATIWISRPEVAETYLAPVRAHSPQALVIYDTVDLHWLRFERGEPFTTDPIAGRQRAQRYRQIELANARAADRVIAITEDEQSRLLEEEPALDVRVMPNIHPVAEHAAGFESRRNLFFIGGFQHEPNVDAMHYFVEAILPLVRRQLPDIKLQIVGSHMTDSIRALQSADIDAVGYVTDVEPCFAKARVFVAPLRHGAGMKGKIGHSLSQGLPVVTTRIGAEGIGLRDGIEALIADDPDEFANAVVRLYQDEALWSKLATAGLNLMRSRYSKEVLALRLSELLVPVQTNNSDPVAKSLTNRQENAVRTDGKASGLEPLENDRRVLVLGIYLADVPNHAAVLSRQLLSARDWDVDLRWAAVGSPPERKREQSDANLESLTCFQTPNRVPKFELLNRLLSDIKLENYRYLLLIDDDIELPEGFLDDFLAIQEARGFTLAQPARTHDSFTDHHFVNQLYGIESRSTRFVEIGPLLSLRRDGYETLLPFDEDAPMGWGLDFIWPLLLEQHNKRLGIVDATPIRHALRKQVSTYDYSSTESAMQAFLAQRPHLTLTEACVASQTYPLSSA